MEKKKKNIHWSQSLGTCCTIFTAVADSTCDSGLTQFCFKCVLCLVAVLGGLFKSLVRYQSARRIPLCAYCKTKDSDQVFMSVNAFEILLVFMNSGCAVGIQKRLWLLRRTAPWEPPWFKCQHDLRTLVWERLRVKRQANMSQWRISPSGPKCTMEQRALVCTHTHSGAYSTFFPPPRGGKAHKQCGALSSLLKMKVLQKRQPQLSNDSTGKPVYQFTEMMCGKNRCETLTWASPLTFRACQRLHLY